MSTDVSAADATVKPKITPITEAEIKYAKLSFVERMLPRLTVFKTADIGRCLFELYLPFSQLNESTLFRKFNLTLQDRHIRFFRISNIYNFLFPAINFCMACQCRKEAYDPVRANAAKEVFKNMGAETEELNTADDVKIETMLLQASILKDKIKKCGGEWKKMEIDGQGECFVIVPPNTVDQKIPENWQEFYDSTLSPMKKLWEEVEVTCADGKRRKVMITAHNAHLIPDIGSNKRKTRLIMFSEIAMPMTMRKRRVADFLGQGLDVAMYNGHGMEDREGIASEEASYEDVSVFAEHVFAKKKDTDGVPAALSSKLYNPSSTCLFATCGSTFSGSYLLKKYKNINCFFEAPPTSLKAAIDSFHWIVRAVSSVALFTLSLICSWKITNISRSTNEMLHTSNQVLRQKYKDENEDVDELDGWDTEKKIEALEADRPGYAIFIGIEGDNLSTPDSVQKLADQLRAKTDPQRGKVEYLRFAPGGRGAHFQNGWEDPNLQEPILRTIHRKD